jgi:hypothetical protein
VHWRALRVSVARFCIGRLLGRIVGLGVVLLLLPIRKCGNWWGHGDLAHLMGVEMGLRSISSIGVVRLCRTRVPFCAVGVFILLVDLAVLHIILIRVLMVCVFWMGAGAWVKCVARTVGCVLWLLVGGSVKVTVSGIRHARGGNRDSCYGERSRRCVGESRASVVPRKERWDRVKRVCE